MNGEKNRHAVFSEAQGGHSAFWEKCKSWCSACSKNRSWRCHMATGFLGYFGQPPCSKNRPPDPASVLNRFPLARRHAPVPYTSTYSTWLWRGAQGKRAQVQRCVGTCYKPVLLDTGPWHGPRSQAAGIVPKSPFCDRNPLCQLMHATPLACVAVVCVPEDSPHTVSAFPHARNGRAPMRQRGPRSQAAATVPKSPFGDRNPLRQCM